MAAWKFIDRTRYMAWARPLWAWRRTGRGRTHEGKTRGGRGDTGASLALSDPSGFADEFSTQATLRMSPVQAPSSEHRGKSCIAHP
eukprot:scaffold190075_cov32-Tisochrysis_lutea.AAC.1